MLASNFAFGVRSESQRVLKRGTCRGLFQAWVSVQGDDSLIADHSLRQRVNEKLDSRHEIRIDRVVWYAVGKNTQRV